MPYEKTGQACPTCKDLMVVGFQIPKCERCELGGKEPVHYWCTYNARVLARERAARAVAFERREMAERWMRELRDGRGYPDTGVMHALQSAHNKQLVLTWKVVEEKDHAIEGAKHFDAYLFETEAEAEQMDMHSYLKLVVP